MNVNVKFAGVMEDILSASVKAGLAKTKTEALRLGLLTLDEKYKLLERMEELEDIKEAERILNRVSQGKEKLHSEKELMKLLR